MTFIPYADSQSTPERVWEIQDVPNRLGRDTC